MRQRSSILRMRAQNVGSRGNMKPTVISTFAGCGGSSLGYKMAGFRELLAVEWDDHAVKIFKINFPDVPVYHGDIAKLSSAECMQMAGINKGELDVLDGSPPCQGFSTTGKRKYDDPRNSLFNEFARLANDMRPKVFVMENVTGMVKGHMKQAYLEIVKPLRGCGYVVKGEVLNAMYYNVPQSRQRVIIIGVRNDLNIEPSHPKPQTRPITFRQATKDLWDDDADLYFNPNTLTTIAMKKARQGEKDPKHFSRQKLHADKPGHTLRKDVLGYWHPEKFRPLNLNEWVRLGSFPDEFKWTDKKNACHCIGNSVPPNLMKAIALHVKGQILERM